MHTGLHLWARLDNNIHKRDNTITKKVKAGGVIKLYDRTIMNLHSNGATMPMKYAVYMYVLK
jgi:hypothetical protein